MIFSSLSNFLFDSFGSEFGSGAIILKPGSSILLRKPVKCLKFYGGKMCNYVGFSPLGTSLQPHELS